MRHNMRRHGMSKIDEWDYGGVAYMPAQIVWNCTLECGRSPAVAYELHYDSKKTQWVYVCEECQDDETRAPYWWNRALRGETLDGEEE